MKFVKKRIGTIGGSPFSCNATRAKIDQHSACALCLEHLENIWRELLRCADLSAELCNMNLPRR